MLIIDNRNIGRSQNSHITQGTKVTPIISSNNNCHGYLPSGVVSQGKPETTHDKLTTFLQPKAIPPYKFETTSYNCFVQ